MVSLSAKDRMLKRAAQDIRAGMVVNLGIGLPTQVLQYIPKDLPVCLHSENGILGVGPTLGIEHADRNLIDAGGAYVSEIDGSAYVDSATSFALVRSGRLDLTMLGAFEVAANGDIANWMIPGKFTPGAGGAIELAQKARKVGVVSMHTNRDGSPKILEKCTMPLTAKGTVSLIYTDMAVFNIVDHKLILKEIAEGISLDAVKNATGADFTYPKELGTF